MQAVLRPDRLFHIGVVTDDFDAAMESLSASLGVTWRAHGPMTLEMCLYGEMRTVEIRFALTVEGPPHLELLSTVPDSPWAEPSGGGVHHLCYWADDGRESCRALEGQGWRRIWGRPGDPSGYFLSPQAVLVEIVSRRMRDDLVAMPAEPAGG